MSGGSARMMRSAVEWLGEHPGMQTPFFWSGFFTLRMVYPLQYLLLRELIGCSSVLDLGCGRHSMVPIIPKKIRTVGVELFKPHFDLAVRSQRHNEYINADLNEVAFADRSFDAVVMLDVLEHLTRQDGLRLLEKMERWAVKKVVIFTPNGFVQQDEYADNPHMVHKSGWVPADFTSRGYRVRGIRGFKKLKKDHVHEHDEEVKESAWDRLVDLTQVITYHVPGQAFQLFCVKDLKPSR